jgi:hypothetical protein
MMISSVGYGLGVGFPAGWAAGRWGAGRVIATLIAGGVAALGSGLAWGVLDAHPGVGALVTLAVAVAVPIALRRHVPG